jgi:hypothetical protein
VQAGCCRATVRVKPGGQCLPRHVVGTLGSHPSVHEESPNVSSGRSVGPAEYAAPVHGGHTIRGDSEGRPLPRLTCCPQAGPERRSRRPAFGKSHNLFHRVTESASSPKGVKSRAQRSQSGISQSVLQGARRLAGLSWREAVNGGVLVSRASRAPAQVGTSLAARALPHRSCLPSLRWPAKRRASRLVPQPPPLPVTGTRLQ